MNELLLDQINGLAGQSSIVDAAGKFAAEQGIFVLAAILGAYGLYRLRVERGRTLRVGVAAGLAVCLALAVAFVCGLLITEARPFVTDSDTALLIKHAKDNSFPSDHATVASAAAVVAALAWPRWAWLFLVPVAAIGVARIFVGVHYPGDIVGGFAIGTLAALLAWEVVELRPDRWVMTRVTRTRVAARN